MSDIRNYPINNNFDLMNTMHLAAQTLSSQGFACQVTPMGPQAGMLVVGKDRDGFTNILGLGIECRATFTVINQTQLTVNIENEWSNKIVALVVGWFCCLVPLVTGAIGAYNQSELSGKITNAINVALASSGSAGTTFNGYGYQQPNNFNNNHPNQ